MKAYEYIEKTKGFNFNERSTVATVQLLIDIVDLLKKNNLNANTVKEVVKEEKAKIEKTKENVKKEEIKEEEPKKTTRKRKTTKKKGDVNG